MVLQTRFMQKMWLPVVLLSTCFMDISSLNVHRMESEAAETALTNIRSIVFLEKCQRQITHPLGHFSLNGEPAILRCPVFEYVMFDFTKFQIVWGKKGAETNTAGDDSRIQINQEALWFLPALTEDSGIYSCIIRNSSFCVEISVSLKVVSDAPLSSSSDIEYKLIAHEDSDFHMYCPDIGDFAHDPKNMKLRWYKNDEALANDNSRFQYSDGTTHAFIHNVGSDDEGHYKCQLDFTYQNKDFTVSRMIYLKTIDQSRKQHPVIVKPSQKTIAAAIGSKLIIPCKVFNGPAETRLMVWWQANDSYVDEYSEDGRVVQSTLQKTTETEGQYTEVSLIFERVEEEDFNTDFKCIASNEHGHEILPTQIRPEASTFAWYIAAVPALVVSLLVVIILISKHRKSGKY
ncbi:interleukin-1 receptor type 2-like [Gastrophryne carolinensis]